MALSDRQKLFAKYYVVSLNASEAALKSGYSKKYVNRTAYRLLQKPEIQKAIQEEMKKRSKRVEISQDQVITDLLEIKERCLQRAPVVDRRGDQIQDEEGRDVWSFDAKDALRALELLGKHLGMFAEKSKLDIDGALEININYGDGNEGDS